MIMYGKPDPLKSNLSVASVFRFEPSAILHLISQPPRKCQLFQVDTEYYFLIVRHVFEGFESAGIHFVK